MIGDSYCLEFCSMMQREVNTPLFHSSLNSLCVALPSNIGSVSDFTQSSRVRLPVLFTNMQKQQFSCTMCWSTSECYWICCTSNYGIQTCILSTTDNLHCVALLSNMRFGAAYLIQFWGSRKNKAFPTCLSQNQDHVKIGPKGFGTWWIFTMYWKITPSSSSVRIIFKLFL
jgi:hypothetical protein